MERNGKTLRAVLMTTNNISKTEPREKLLESSIIQTPASLNFLGMAL